MNELNDGKHHEIAISSQFYVLHVVLFTHVLNPEYTIPYHIYVLYCVLCGDQLKEAETVGSVFLPQ